MKNISVHYKKQTDLEKIISTATKSEIYDVVKVDCFIEKIQNYQDSLRMASLQVLFKKLIPYENMLLKLDTLKKIVSDNFVTVYPQTRYFSYQSFTNTGTNVNVRGGSSRHEGNAIQKPYIKFYQPVDYDTYDFVINPVVTEPVIQLSYSIVVKYILPMDNSIKNNYFMVSTAGDLKQLNLSK